MESKIREIKNFHQLDDQVYLDPEFRESLRGEIESHFGENIREIRLSIPGLSIDSILDLLPNLESINQALSTAKDEIASRGNTQTSAYFKMHSTNNPHKQAYINWQKDVMDKLNATGGPNLNAFRDEDTLDNMFLLIVAIQNLYLRLEDIEKTKSSFRKNIYGATQA